MVDRKEILTAINRSIEWSLYILIFSLPFSKTLIEIAASVAIACWILKKFLSVKDGLKLPYTELNLPLLIFLFISFLSIFWSTHVEISLRAFIRKLLEYVLLYFIVVDTVTERRVVGNILKALAISLFIMSIDCIYQKVVGYDFIRGYPMFSLLSVTGSFKFPNGLSAWLIIVSFPFISLMLFYPIRRAVSSSIDKKEGWRLKIVSSALTILSVYCLYFTHTRGGIISFIFALMFMLLLRGGKVYLIICTLFIIAILAVASIIPEGADGYKGIKYYIGLSELFSGITSQHRIRMWTAGWRMFIDRPLLGQGLNTFMANYAKFKVPDQTVGTWYAHNCYLQIAAEIGIFGLLSFLWMMARMAITSIKSWKLIEDGFLRYIYLGLFCGIVSFLMQSFVETNLYALQLAVLFYFSLGLLMGIKRIGLNEI